MPTPNPAKARHLLEATTYLPQVYTTDDRVARFLADLAAEYTQARAKHGGYASHHEAYAVLLEEVQEYWEEVRRHDDQRDPDAMYAELVQVAQVAMAAAVMLLGDATTKKE